MSRQEDFNNQTDKYVEERKSFGVNDPYALKEIGEAYCQGAEYGYQYAKKMIEDYLLCVELSNFFPTLSDEDANKGKEALTKSIKEFLEDM